MGNLNRLVVADSGYTASRTDEEGVPSTRWITGLWGPGSFSYDAMGNMKAAKLGAGRPGGREAHLTYVGTTPKIDVVSQMEVRPPDGLLVSRGRRRMAADASIGVSGQMIYDDAGNERSLLATRTYSPRNLLESIEEPSETSERHVVAYGYDGRNVRIARSEWTTGMLAAPAALLHLYAGAEPALDDQRQRPQRLGAGAGDGRQHALRHRLVRRPSRGPDRRLRQRA